MEKKFITLFINKKRYHVNSYNKPEFGMFFYKKNYYYLNSVSSETKSEFEIISSLYQGNFDDIKIVGKKYTGETEVIENDLSIAYDIYQIILYFWYIHHGKHLPVYFKNKKLKENTVENRIKLKEHISFFIHKVLYDGSMFTCVQNLLNDKELETKISGVVLNHNQGRAEFTLLKPKKYALRATAAYLCDKMDICPSFVFDDEEFLKLNKTNLQNLTKKVIYDKNKKYSNKNQPNLKNLDKN